MARTKENAGRKRDQNPCTTTMCRFRKTSLYHKQPSELSGHSALTTRRNEKYTQEEWLNLTSTSKTQDVTTKTTPHGVCITLHRGGVSCPGSHCFRSRPRPLFRPKLQGPILSALHGAPKSHCCARSSVRVICFRAPSRANAPVLAAMPVASRALRRSGM